MRAAVEEWIAGDPDPQTRAELRRLLDEEAVAELEDRFAGELRFGTAGIRGEVGAGPNRMNRAVVVRATCGLAEYLRAATPPNRGPVVVGRDARLSSAAFMEDTVGVLVAAGLRVVWFPEPIPTPIVAFWAREVGAAAAVVITASHNPSRDNGYKVYGADAVQIVPPTDAEIAAAIDRVGPAAGVPRDRTPYRHPHATPAPDDVIDRYLRAVARAVPGVAADRELSIVYTPLHGVGGRWTTAALQRFGFRAVTPVAKQFEPDGRFPTVDYPNPEESGVLDLAHELASAVGAELVIANDPDADRLAVSLPDLGGGWRRLTGNQIGVLLADHLLGHSRTARPIVISTVVSSPMVERVAAAHGAVFARTLTGFKWLWHAALDLEAAGKGEFLFAYEEALGYSVTPAVRDKDGIAAAVVFAQLVGSARREGRSPWDLLERLYGEHGLWVDTQVAVRRSGAEGRRAIEEAMTRLEETRPADLDGLEVTRVVDYRHGAEHRPRWLPVAELVELHLGDAGVVRVRPSGTEPKLKVYVDLVEPLGAEPWWAHHDRLLERARRVGRALVDDLGLA